MSELKKGTSLQGDKYTIERRLGSGSFGITYLAAMKVMAMGPLGSVESTIPVTVKEFFMTELNSRGTDGSSVEGSRGMLVSDYRRKFVREAQNLSKLSHPGIVKVLEVWDENNTSYYAMEYLDGGSLDDRIERQGGIGEAEALRLTAQIGDALAYMHAHQMLHLDLKPKNIMLRRDGSPVLIDFGLSKQYDAEGNPESSTTVGGGTPGYAPIEQSIYHEGKGFPVTMDVYALGATLFKMLTGEKPPTSSEISFDVTPLTTELHHHHVSPETTGLVLWAMRPDKRQRLQSVRDMLNRIGQSPLPPVEEKTQKGNQEVTVIGVENPMSDPPAATGGQTPPPDRPQPTSIPSPVRKWMMPALVVALVLLGTGIVRSVISYYSETEEVPGGYVDLGLPSGTLWKERNEPCGLITYDEAISKFGSRLPTKAQCEELRVKCTWTWTGNGMRVTGSNGNSITLPAEGSRNRNGSVDSVGSYGYYWSATANGSDNAWTLNFYSGGASMYNYNRCRGLSVRLVQD